MTRAIGITLLCLLIGGPAAAATFTVTSATDGVGTCPSASSCTLRQAITDANTAGGSNQINFAIPGAGAHTITLSAQLPGIANNLVINGSTQSGTVLNSNAPDQGGLNTKLMVEINGGGTQTYGFFVSGNYAVGIEHLAMNGFSGTAISGDPSHTGSSLTVRGCFLGTQLDGTAFPADYGNDVAIRTGAGSAQIGGTLPGERNLISGNRSGAIIVYAAAIIEGNLIGPDYTGSVAIGNGWWGNEPGIIVPGNFPGVRIGCTGAGCATPGSRNIISGNHNYAIGIWDGFTGTGSSGLEIKGNYIGTDWTGAQPLPNGDGLPATGCPNYCGGIQLQGGDTAKPASIIGGFAPGEANLIAFNRGAGIVSAFNRLGESFDSRANEIHHNRGVGFANIDIGALGPTANDADDTDPGANQDQNSPEIISASVSGGQLHVTYRVDSTTANSAYPLRIDFYADVHGGSGAHIGQDTYAAADAQLDKSIALPLPLNVKGIPFVATATSASGYSSEFSAAYDVIFEDGFE